MLTSLLLFGALHAQPEAVTVSTNLTAESLASCSSVIAVATPIEVEHSLGEGRAWSTRMRFSDAPRHAHAIYFELIAVLESNWLPMIGAWLR